MKKKIILMGLIFGSLSSSLCKAQENTAFLYGVVVGNATVGGEFNIFMYYTRISKVDCYISEYDAKNQMHLYFGNITNQWDDYSYIINYFDSEYEAETFRNNAIQKSKEQSLRSRSQLTRQSVADANVPLYFYCK